MNAGVNRPAAKRWSLGFALALPLLASIMLVVSHQAHALTLQRLTIEQMSAAADRIVVARTVSTEARLVVNDNAPGTPSDVQTVIDLQISKVLKGTAGPNLTLVLPGGTVGDLTVAVDWVPHFTRGETSILFLDELGRVIGGPQGKLAVENGEVPTLGTSLLHAQGRVLAAASGGLVAWQDSAGFRSDAVLDLLRKLAGSHLAEQLPGGASPSALTATVATTVFSDGFESGGANWTVSGKPTWAICDYRASAGSQAAYCAGSSISPPGPYSNNMGAVMRAGPFDLTSTSAASLEFDLYLESEKGHDPLFLGVDCPALSEDDLGVVGWSGSTNGSWVHITVDLTEVPLLEGGSYDFTGESSVQLLFMFISDASGTDEGAYVDEVRLTKGSGQPSGPGPVIGSISPWSASAGTDTRVTIQGIGFGAVTGSGGVNFYYDGFSTIPAPIISWSDTKIVCVVPTGIVDGYLASAGSGPVTVTSSSGQTSSGYEYTVTFSYLGASWSSATVPYRLNANTADTAYEEGAVDSAAALWNAASGFKFVDSGTCTTTYTSGWDGYNDIYWSYEAPYGVLGWTAPRIEAGVYLEADIAMNDFYTWANGAGDTEDLAAVVLHEMGHVVGLRDLYGPGDTAKVMYGLSRAGAQRHTLHRDDTAGALWIYGTTSGPGGGGGDGGGGDGGGGDGGGGENPFTDILAGHPYYDAIIELASRGIISGFEDDTFRAGATVTRQQFAKMIVRTKGYTVTGAEFCPFKDVAVQMGTDPFYPSKYVAVCAAYGITTGKTPTTFAPDENITHQQLITMVARAANLSDPPPGYTPEFTPSQFSLQDHYLNARKAAYAGLLAGLQGVGPSYNFLAASTRGECAQILYNLLGAPLPS